MDYRHPANTLAMCKESLVDGADRKRVWKPGNPDLLVARVVAVDKDALIGFQEDGCLQGRLVHCLSTVTLQNV